MKCYCPISVENSKDGGRVTVPCGWCDACKKNRSADWAFRLEEQQKNSMSAFFVTLTYNDTYIPTNDEGFQTLNKEHIIRYNKRLRKKLQTRKGGASRLYKEYPFKYYTVGEYGTNTIRPHYHSIMYNIHADDQEMVLDCWQEKWEKTKHKSYMGFVTIDQLIPARIRYVTNYITNKKQKKYYEDLNIVPPFSMMSKGLGYNYVEDCKKWHTENNAYYSEFKGYKQRLPRYYKEKIWTNDIERDAINQEIRKKVQEEEKKQENKLGKYKFKSDLHGRKQYSAKIKRKDKKNKTL